MKQNKIYLLVFLAIAIFSLLGLFSFTGLFYSAFSVKEANLTPLHEFMCNSEGENYFFTTDMQKGFDKYCDYARVSALVFNQGGNGYVPIHNFDCDKGQLLTMNLAEGTTYSESQNNCVYQGVEFYTLLNPEPDSVPLHVFLCDGKDNFYTSSYEEGKYYGCDYKGTLGFVYRSRKN
ncbi:hypothetical protein HZA97_01225 [Candidatus Woesearchaeota archaeon]|nr:hypothetical protein [Candidatus Woesearchaeota archaeon]